MSIINERVRLLRKKVQKLEEELRKIKLEIRDLEEKTMEEYDGSWYTSHGHGD